MDILIAIIVLGSLGAVFGLGLAVAAKKFCVTTDPRIDNIFHRLPGGNCGACGMAGCMNFAEGLIQGSCSVNKCAVVAEKERDDIFKILGIEEEAKIKKVAVLGCNGGEKIKDRFLYEGIEDCVSANLVLGGQKECVFGCLGFGTCVAVCPFGAIRMSAEGLPIVDKDKCKACNKCVEVCPKKLFSLVPATHNVYPAPVHRGGVYVACSSHDLGKDTKAVCSVGCIACRLCEKACPVDAIHVIDNLAVIDYNKCTSCGACVEACPMKTIRIRE